MYICKCISGSNFILQTFQVQTTKFITEADKHVQLTDKTHQLQQQIQWFVQSKSSNRKFVYSILKTQFSHNIYCVKYFHHKYFKMLLKLRIKCFLISYNKIFQTMCCILFSISEQCFNPINGSNKHDNFFYSSLSIIFNNALTLVVTLIKILMSGLDVTLL